ncbi:hypothetical protein K501DRAFT_292927 [Backusella circina FSU 941]|nr:hypothetical protein K501DRAFT_292927 [Backusella circina FSU 941]
MTACLLCPKPRADICIIEPKEQLRASQPWSNSSPRGLEEPVLRACFPSTLSKVEYIHKPKANENEEQPSSSVDDGESDTSSSSSIQSPDDIKESQQAPVPQVVIRNFGNSANLIALNINPKDINVNNQTPRDQEKADEPFLRAIHHLFNNRFMKAKKLFEQQASSQQTTDDAHKVLLSIYDLATTQIDKATKRNVGSSVIQYFSSYCNYIKLSRGTGVPTYVSPVKPIQLELHKVNTISNGVLRAHVVKAEACLQIAILHLLQESVTGYIKCGLNLRRAYASYNVVWKEYKRLGQLHNEYIDYDTISGIQFGIGAVHLVLSSLPQKILRIIAAFGWKADKHLGFALLKLCLEERRARSPMASLMLLAYYTTLTSLCPQILANEYTQLAIETLLDAQRMYPNSAIFLYFAGKTSRLARNLPLSAQSFIYAIETSRNEWAEVEVLHMCSYEIGFNHMMQNNWEEAVTLFDSLYREKYWSPIVLRYLTGACLDMMGKRTEAILAFADISHTIPNNHSSTDANTRSIEHYVLRKVALFQSSGYQDMDMILCALEFMYLYNAYEFMDHIQMNLNLQLVDFALGKILEAEKLEYGIRSRELLPDTPPPQYDDQRGALLLIKSSILNAMGRYKESVIHLNWIIDRKDKVLIDKWIVPFAYWETGMTSWHLGQKARSRVFWEKALSYSKYDFEYRLALRVNLAITRADELGICKIDKKIAETTPESSIAVLRMEEDDDLSMPSSPELESKNSQDIGHVDVLHPATQIVY